MVLGIFRNFWLSRIFDICLFFIFMGFEICKKCDFLSKFDISDQKWPFWHISGHIKIKKAEIENPAKSKVSKYPKEHFYQFLDQLSHFPRTSSIFSLKSGYARSGLKKRKKTPFFAAIMVIFGPIFPKFPKLIKII